MTIAEVNAHLVNHHLYVVERSTSRRGLPSVASFYLITDGMIERIDNVVVMLLGGYAPRWSWSVASMLPVSTTRT